MAMASCHSLNMVAEQMVGDPMDIILFENAGYSLQQQTPSSAPCSPNGKSMNPKVRKIFRCAFLF